MQVAGDHQLDVGAGRRDHRANEVIHAVVGVPVLDGLHPGGRRRTEDDPVAWSHLLGDPPEIAQLRVVDIGTGLRVGAEQPPAVRELDCEI